jgi:hypothetical protein
MHLIKEPSDFFLENNNNNHQNQYKKPCINLVTSWSFKSLTIIYTIPDIIIPSNAKEDFVFFNHKKSI